MITLYCFIKNKLLCSLNIFSDCLFRIIVFLIENDQPAEERKCVNYMYIFSPSNASKLRPSRIDKVINKKKNNPHG
jgi:hypothetical protein